MQINGSSLSTVFLPRSNDAREPVRPPIIIDAEPRARSVRPLLPATTEPSPFQTALSIDRDVRQQRFDRLFADDNASVSDTKEANALPRGVEQYIQIASLDSDPQQRLFDALV
jgi:hypothetical protein